MGSWTSALGERLLARMDSRALARGIQAPGVAALFLGCGYVGGAALALSSMALPQPPGTSIAGLCSIYAVAIAAGVYLLARGERVRDREVAGALMLGAVLVTLAINFTQQRAGVYSMFYVWVALEAAYFLPRRPAILIHAFIAASFAVVLFTEKPAGAEEEWFITVGTISVVGLLVGALKAHVGRLIRRLADAAQTDPLTELHNRRGFQEVLEHELARAGRTGRPVSLLVGDLDHFKHVNDQLGHAGGDDALRHVAQRMRRLTRDADVAARLGGEEFALLLPETDKGDAYLIAERLRRSVRSAFADTSTPLTVSVGVTTHPDDGATADELLLTGDQAMYAAKQLGRDRSVLFHTDTMAELKIGEPVGRDSSPREQLSSVLLLAETIDGRDPGTARHSRAVGRYAEAIARQLGLPDARAERVALAGVLHDVGKVGIPDATLRKPGPLDDAEWTQMRTHPELGARVLAGARLEELAEWVFAHHERLDGKGYPLGLTTDEIPLEARILAAAEAYEAMTGARPYSTPMTHEQAAAELRRCSGTQFDARVVEALLAAEHRPADVADGLSATA